MKERAPMCCSRRFDALARNSRSRAEFSAFGIGDKANKVMVAVAIKRTGSIHCKLPKTPVQFCPSP
jgi:hypothetical protein